MSKNRNPETGGKEERQITNASSAVTPTEIDGVTVISDTTRSVGIFDSSSTSVAELYLPEDYLTFDKKRGTPQKRLHDLLFACKHIVAHNKKYFNKITTKMDEPDINLLILDLNTASREKMFNTPSDGENYSNYIRLFISSVKQSSMSSVEKSQIFILLWELILVKSISDISQCGSLINDIPKLYDNNIIPVTTTVNNVTNRVLNVLNNNKNVTFVSSDKICAALSSNILKLIDYPIQTLCGRKNPPTTQTVIVQKGYISALAVVLSAVEDQLKYDTLINDILSYNFSETNNLQIQEGVINTILEIQAIVVTYVERLLTNNSELSELNLLAEDKIQKEIDEVFEMVNKSRLEPRIIRLCNLIHGIAEVENLVTNLEHLFGALSFSKNNKIVHRWTYHVSNDVFKYKFQLKQDMFNEDKLKDSISREEILSATFDAMYGHDYELSCITELGSCFLNAISENDDYDIEKELPYPVKQNRCISQTLHSNRFSTVNQEGDKFSISFNSDNNYLNVEKKELLHRNSEIPWNITKSPLVSQDLVASIDFVSGEPSISTVLSQQINISKRQNIEQQQVYVFSVLGNNSEKLIETFQKIKENSSYEEYYGVTTLYDGAAPYGGIPKYILGQYETSMMVRLKPTSKEKNSMITENKLTITTQTTYKIDEMLQSWLSERINTVEVRYLQDTILPNIPIDCLELLKNPTKDSIYEKFNLIWGTILNTKSKMTIEYRNDIYHIFSKVFSEIIKKLSESDRPKRGQIVERFYDYNRFKEIEDSIEKISSVKNFDSLMIEYIQILCLTALTDYQKNLLLDIFDVVVREKCSGNNPDGLFKNLYSSEIEKTPKELTTEQEKLKQVLTNAFNRNRDVLVVKDSNFQRRQNLKEKNQLVFSPVKVTENLPPGSAPAVVTRSLIVGNTTVDNTNDGDNRLPNEILNFNSLPPETPEEFEKSVPMDTSSFGSSIRNETAVPRTSFDSGESGNPSAQKKLRPNESNQSKKRPPWKGGNQCALTRRKNNSSKRKTIKRKMPKRKNKTRRNK